MNDRQITAVPPATSQAGLVLPKGARLGPFEVQRLIARGASSFVYLATDHALAMPVVLQEYLAARMVWRDSWLHLHPSDEWHEDVLSRGMAIFIDESRLLARCEHPALVRVNHLFEANGTAYRVMPFHPGQRLSDVRSAMTEPPAEAPLRALLDPLLGALETIHRLEQVHGGVSASNILLVDDDFPLLLSPGGAAHELRSDLVESLMATVESQPGALLPESFPAGPSIDLCALAEVMRFCITGDATLAPKPREPLAALIAREPGNEGWPVYSPEFIGTIDAATSSSPEDWPTSVAQFRLWLTHGTPAARATASRRALAVTQASSAGSVEKVSPTTSFADTELADPDRIAEEPAGPVFIPIEAMLADQAVAALASPARRPAASVQSWRGLSLKLLFGGALAAVAAVFIGWISGAWTAMPPIALDRAAAAPQLTAPLAPPANPTTPAPPAPESRLARSPASMPASAAAPPQVLSSPPSSDAAQAGLASAPADDAPAAGPGFDATRTLAANPPGAGPKTRASRAESRARLASAKTARSPVDPRTACAGRSEFALYRCMRQQCQTVKWATHPQCVRLRLDDQVG